MRITIYVVLIALMVFVLSASARGQDTLYLPTVSSGGEAGIEGPSIEEVVADLQAEGMDAETIAAVRAEMETYNDANTTIDSAARVHQMPRCTRAAVCVVPASL